MNKFDKGMDDFYLGKNIGRDLGLEYLRGYSYAESFYLNDTNGEEQIDDRTQPDDRVQPSIGDAYGFIIEERFPISLNGAEETVFTDWFIQFNKHLYKWLSSAETAMEIYKKNKKTHEFRIVPLKTYL